MYIGIDPGISGYVCTLVPSQGTTLFSPAPVTKDEEHDPDALCAFVRPWIGTVSLVAIEKQQAFPGFGPKCHACKKPLKQQGVSSTGKTMFGYGLWVAALKMAGVPHRIFLPQEWKGPLGLDADKEKSVKKAQALSPTTDFRPLERKPNSRVSDHNKCEAFLLAVTARKYHLAGR